MADAPKQPAKPAEPKELGKQIALDRQVGALRFSPCGKLLAAGGYDATVRLWRVTDAEPRPLPTISGHHHGWVDALAFVPSSTLLITADSWGRLSCWDYSTWLNDDAKAPGDTTASPSPQRSPSRERERKPIWTHEQAHDGYIRSVAASPDGKHLATCGRDQAVRLWTPDGKLAHDMKDHREDIYSLAFSPDSAAIASGDIKGVIRIWSVADGKQQRQIDATSLFKLDRIQDVGGARVLAFSRDGNSLYCGGATPKGGGFLEAYPKILRFNFKTGQREDEIVLGEPKDGYVYGIDDHPAGFLMAITSGQPGNGKLVLLKPGEKEPAFTTTKMANTHALAVHPDGRRFAIASTNGGSNGNGRSLKNGEYVGNHSPIHLWTLPGDAT